MAQGPADRSLSLYMTPEEAANLLKISVRQITQWLNDYEDSGGSEGIPGGMRLGRVWRIHRDTFNGWLDDKQPQRLHRK